MVSLSLRGALVTGLAVVCLVPLRALPSDPPTRRSGGVRLHNGWKITPAGTHETTGDMLLGCALSPDSKILALTSVGDADHRLILVDTATVKIRQSLALERAWNGVAWAKDGTAIYVSGGASP